jgi:hypothetical protein
LVSGTAGKTRAGSRLEPLVRGKDAVVSCGDPQLSLEWPVALKLISPGLATTIERRCAAAQTAAAPTGVAAVAEKT